MLVGRTQWGNGCSVSILTLSLLSLPGCTISSKSLPSPVPTPYLLIYNFFMWIFLYTFLLPSLYLLLPDLLLIMTLPWTIWASLVAQMLKNLPARWETWVRSLGWEDTLEKGTATHFIILAKFHGIMENSMVRGPGLQSMGLQRVRHDWAIFTRTILQLNCSLPHFLKQRWFSQLIRNSEMKLKNKITKLKNFL